MLLTRRKIHGRLLLSGLLAASAAAHAQSVIRNDESLGSNRPETWAMSYVAASTLMTGFGLTPALPPGQWTASFDLGHIPRLGESQQRVGFAGTKQEDLNRSPVFGRARFAVGLPGGLVAELGYTPPTEISNTSARNLFSVALGRRLYENGRLGITARIFRQHGSASGDITCPAALADAPAASNPYGCRAASNDRIGLRYYGVDATAGWNPGEWNLHATAGMVRADLSVQVDALTVDVRDRSYLSARPSWPFATLGASYDLDARWNLGAEVLYVPLRVQRELSGPRRTEALTSLRLRLLYRFS